jgi:hypothetical protein
VNTGKTEEEENLQESAFLISISCKDRNSTIMITDLPTKGMYWGNLPGIKLIFTKRITYMDLE